jgi:SAM-dependent methyltransferase
VGARTRLADGARALGIAVIVQAIRELRESLGVTSMPVSRTISPYERMPADDVDGYLEVGCSALTAIRISQLSAAVPDFDSILDMACGHGRVTRWLRAAYPDAQITACDLITDGVDFCARAFGATPVYSSNNLTPDAFPERYDLIFVGSLLTHVDVAQWDRLIALWHTLLRPEGLLVMTTHGELVAARMRAGHLYGYPAQSITGLLRAFEHARFAFLEESPDNIDYGITLAKPDWTLARVGRHADLEVVLYSAALWHNHQDVVAVLRHAFEIPPPERAVRSARRWRPKKFTRHFFMRKAVALPRLGSS